MLSGLVSTLRSRGPCLRGLPASLSQAPSHAPLGLCLSCPSVLWGHGHRSITCFLATRGSRLQTPQGLWSSPPAFPKHIPHVPPIEPTAGSAAGKTCTPALTRLWALCPRTQDSPRLESPQPLPSCTELVGSALCIPHTRQHPCLSSLPSPLGQ